MAAHLTSKGQVTVPKAVRDYLGLKHRSAVTFERLPGGEVVLRSAEPGRQPRPRSAFSRIRGTATVRMKTEDILALTRGD